MSFVLWKETLWILTSRTIRLYSRSRLSSVLVSHLMITFIILWTRGRQYTCSKGKVSADNLISSKSLSFQSFKDLTTSPMISKNRLLPTSMPFTNQRSSISISLRTSKKCNWIRCLTLKIWLRRDRDSPSSTSSNLLWNSKALVCLSTFTITAEPSLR